MTWKLLIASFFILLFPLSSVEAAGLIDRVNEAFRSVHGRTPSVDEWRYWAQRVQRGDKTTFTALVGAIAYQRAQAGGSPAVGASATPVASTVGAASGFRTHRHLYPSSANPNFLPDGTLIKSASRPEVFYVRNGKKSWVLPSILNRWLGENHFFKHDRIITVSDSDLARYPQTSSVNPLYVGKVLQHPDGTQYYIDDKLRKRKLSSGVRAALKFPAKNLYATSSAHLQEFSTGPALSGSLQPGGMVIYSGPYHGGRIWRIEENAQGKMVKRLFLSDYLYEAYGYPDESQRVAASDADLARYPRSSNIERYPDGWIVGLGANLYVVEKGALRLIASPAIFNALGYKPQHVLRVFPEFLKRYPQGHPIAAFKTVTASGAEAAKSAPAAAPSAATDLTKVRPAVRSLITQINDLYLSVFDKDVTASENKFWVDYVYNGEVNNKADLLAKMRGAKASGKKPARTSRTAVLSEESLERHWFPYLFYFVHQKEPTEDDRAYWYGRIRSGDRDSIEKLGGTLQWLKETTGQTRR